MVGHLHPPRQTLIPPGHRSPGIARDALRHRDARPACPSPRPRRWPCSLPSCRPRRSLPSQFPLVQRTSTSIIGEVNPNPDASFPTVPANGDVNPYGVAFVPSRFPSGGPLQPGDALVSNFNDSDVTCKGPGRPSSRSVPAGASRSSTRRSPGIGTDDRAWGLETRLRCSWVMSRRPTTATAIRSPSAPDYLLILDRSGNLVGTLSNPASCWMAPGT